MSTPLSLGLYRLASGLVEPLAPRLLRGRADRGKEDRTRLSERLGQASLPRPDGPLVWMHGASVGETTSLLPFINRLAHDRPDLHVLVTSGTRTSAALLAQRLPACAVHQYLPVDGPRAVAAFLDHWRPDVGIIAESELWPNLILSAKKRGLKLALISARITADSAKGWTKAPAAARALLSAFTLILPQDTASAARIEALGGVIGPMLNLKYAGEALACDVGDLARLKIQTGPRKVVLAASTHPGEEALVIRAFNKAIEGITPLPLLVIAPRHPERGPALVSLFARGATARRAAGEMLTANTEIYVADTLGEMGLMFRLADVVVMGGSFVEKVGGHNPLEPARLGRPIVTGPGDYNFRHVYDQMLKGETAALRAETEDDLAAKIKLLLTDEARARALGEGAHAFAARQALSAGQAMTTLEAMLPAAPR